MNSPRTGSYRRLLHLSIQRLDHGQPGHKQNRRWVNFVRSWWVTPIHFFDSPPLPSPKNPNKPLRTPLINGPRWVGPGTCRGGGSENYSMSGTRTRNLHSTRGTKHPGEYVMVGGFRQGPAFNETEEGKGGGPTMCLLSKGWLLLLILSGTETNDIIHGWKRRWYGVANRPIPIPPNQPTNAYDLYARTTTTLSIFTTAGFSPMINSNLKFAAAAAAVKLTVLSVNAPAP